MRSVVAVGAGILSWGLLWVSANAGLAAVLPTRFDAAGVATDPLVLVAFLGICTLLCVMAGWLCARIAGRSIMKHVLALALIQLAIGIAVQTSVWGLMPAWYHLSFLGLVVPMHLVGGKLRMAQLLKGRSQESRPVPPAGTSLKQSPA